MRKMAVKKFNSHALITSAIRKIWLWSPQRRNIITACKVRVGRRVFIECEACHKLFEPNQIQVHHIESVGSIFSITLQEVIDKMFTDNLKVLCKSCHKEAHK